MGRHPVAKGAQDEEEQAVLLETIAATPVVDEFLAERRPARA